MTIKDILDPEFNTKLRKEIKVCEHCLNTGEIQIMIEPDEYITKKCPFHD